MANPSLPRRIRFGEFEANLITGELHKDGLAEKILLQDQPLAILCALVARPGEMVSREELIQLLWNGNTNVDFDPSLNKAINRLRESLGDSAEAPRFIETLSRRGYRFIGKIEVLPTTNGGKKHLPRARQKFAAWIVTGAACLLAAWFVYHKIRPSFEPPPMTTVMFTAYPGLEACPAFSPDGSRIAFAWDGDPGPGAKGFDLYVKVIGSENLLRLTRHPSELICPAWSPDGTQIAFTRWSGADPGIYVVPALGGSERKLRPIRLSSVDAVTISWSPEGNLIAFANSFAPGNNTQINLLSVETLESKPIPHAADCINELMPAFSHTGKQLAYICLLDPTDKVFGIYALRLLEGPAKLVTRFKTGWGVPHGVAWTGDDKKLILSRPRFAYDFELDEVTLADGSLRKLPIGQGAGLPAISVKGDKLAFAVASHQVNIWRKDLEHPEMVAVKLASSTRSQDVPQYSPDGRHIVFASDRGGTWEIWMSDADGTHFVRLSDALSSNAIYARWSPDSQKIAFDSRHSDHPEVYIVDVSERLPRKVVTNLPYMSMPSWSHDGKWLYFQSTAPHTDIERIFRCPAIGGDAIALSAKSGYFPWESYDGKTLYFGDARTSAHIVSLQWPAPESLLREMPVVLDPSQWTVIPGGIYFVPADEPKSVRYFDFSTKKVRQIFAVEEGFDDSLSVSPDGRWILYTQVEQLNLDIMLIESFR